VSTNCVILTGRLGKAPEIRTTPSGKSVGVFTLAVDRGYGDKKKTLWVNVEVWNKTAEAVARMVTKGNRVTVVGELDEDAWKDKEGNERRRTKVVAQSVDIIDFADKQADGDNTDDGPVPF